MTLARLLLIAAVAARCIGAGAPRRGFPPGSCGRCFRGSAPPGLARSKRGR